jgi:Metallo-beta-lactamase superfamily
VRNRRWTKSFGKKITGVYITHGHSDHWLGLARLLEHFPEARGYAAPEVAGRAACEAEFNETSKHWTSRFPGELPETPDVPEVPEVPEVRRRRTCRRTWRPAGSTCATSPPSRRAARWRDLVHGMLELHGDRDQPHTLWISA